MAQHELLRRIRSGHIEENDAAVYAWGRRDRERCKRLGSIESEWVGVEFGGIYAEELAESISNYSVVMVLASLKVVRTLVMPEVLAVVSVNPSGARLNVVRGCHLLAEVDGAIEVGFATAR